MNTSIKFKHYVHLFTLVQMTLQKNLPVGRHVELTSKQFLIHLPHSTETGKKHHARIITQVIEIQCIESFLRLRRV